MAFWLGVFLVYFVLWLAGVDLGNWPLWTGFTVFAVSLWLVTRGRRMRVSGAESVLAEDVRAPIVYLRPFGADRAEIARRLSSRVRISPREGFEKTYEERLARTLRTIGRSWPSATRPSGCRCLAPYACMRQTRSGGRQSTS